MVLRWLRTLIWWTVHLVWALAEALRPLRRVFSKGRRLGLPERVPDHLAVILSEEAPPLEELARLVLMCLAANVRRITFYDSTDSLVKDEDKLFALIGELKGDMPGEIKREDGSRVNGFKNGAGTVVDVLGADSGRARIVSAVKRMCERGDVVSTADAVDARLRELYPSLTEPQVAVYFGEMCSARGFPPWHVRLTEFLRLECDGAVEPDDFVRMLHRYAKCQQRLGK